MGLAQDKALFGMTAAGLRELVVELGLPGYRAAQLATGLYQQRVERLEQITTLPVGVREGLVQAGYGVGLPELAQTAKSVDGTERYLVRLADGETVETVWMPGGDGGERGDGTEAAVEEMGEGDGVDGVDPLIARGAMNGARGEAWGDGVVDLGVDPLIAKGAMNGARGEGWGGSGAAPDQGLRSETWGTRFLGCC